MTTSADVINFAKREIGYKEGRNNASKYGEWYGINYAPWCAMFVSYCFYHAGLPLPAQNRKGFASCYYGQKWFKDMGLFTQTGRGPFFPGDVVFFQFDRDTPPDHVGIIMETRPNSVITIEGNTAKTRMGSQSDGGGVYQRERSLSLITGVGRPQYSGRIAPPPPVRATAPAWPGRYLALTSPSMKGEDVKMIQKKMNTWGSRLTVDGDFGRATSDAVRWWQAAHRLSVDGVVGPATWNEFFRH
jgi:hypothetical protein